jgi:alpha-D-ribose 1-methylphosphonate 5-triphosphate synthase subunit PhnG
MKTMTRKRRTKILVNAPDQLAKGLAEEVRASCETFVLEEPNEGLVMIKMKECAQGAQFYIGEALVTEAKVKIGKHIGLGILRGHNQSKALDMATIDAALAEDPQKWQHWVSRLEEAEKDLEVDSSLAAGRIRSTKVDFSTMEV